MTYLLVIKSASWVAALAVARDAIQQSTKNSLTGGLLACTDYIKEIRRQAGKTGKNSITVVADITAFHHFDDVEGMLHYEREMQRLLPEMPNVSVLCCYHKGNFEGLSQDMQDAVFACHTFVIDEKTSY